MTLSNILFPPICYACKMRLDSKVQCLCPDCQTHLIRQKDNLFGEIDPQDRFFTMAVALYLYNYMVRQLLHNFKFRGIQQIGKFFADNAVEILQNEYKDLLKVDATVAVPMLKPIVRERGYNQAAYLCDIISDKLNIPNLSKKIVKTTFTTKQSLKNYHERLHDTEDIYSLKSGLLRRVKQIASPNDEADNCFKDKTILLIDDIFTTGITANILSKFLIQNGAKRVYVFVIAAAGKMNI